MGGVPSGHEPTIAADQPDASGSEPTLAAPAERPGAAIPVGDDERYQRGREIGRGGLGRVVEAFDRRLERPDAGTAPSSASDPRLTAAGAVMGTPAYMPPEQLAGDEVDQRADVFAIGALLHHVLAGAPRGPGQGFAAVAGVPAELTAIVGKAT